MSFVAASLVFIVLSDGSFLLFLLISVQILHVVMITPFLLSYLINIVTHFKLCLDTVTHNFKIVFV